MIESIYTSVAVEGGDAVGKNTQSRLLAKRLAAHFFTFPDYETPTGALLRGHLMGEWAASVKEARPEWASLDMTVRQTLMTINRYEAADAIRRANARNAVVFDRYYVSGVVYGTVEGLNPGWLWDLHSSLPQPAIWVLLDTSVEEGGVRRPVRRDLNERDSAKLERVRHEYLRVFRTEGPRQHPKSHWIIVDGHGTVDEVHDRIWRALPGFRP